MMRPAVLLALLGGCALSLSRPDPQRVGTVPQCDTSKGLVALDGIVAGGLGVLGLSLASNNEGSAGGGMLTIGSLFALSAIRGSMAVDDCRKAFADYEHAVALRGIAPREMQPEGGAPQQVSAPVAPPPPPTPAPAPAPVATTETPAPPPPPKAPEVPRDDPAFHVSLGAPRPTPARTPAKPTPQPPPPPVESWRDFWREVP